HAWREGGILMASIGRSALRAGLIFGLPLIIFAIAAGLKIRAGGATTVAAGPPPALSFTLKNEPAGSPPEPAPVVTETPANREDCAQIRGTDYESYVERDWFKANCSNSTAHGAEPILASGIAAAGSLARSGRAATSVASLPPADIPPADTAAADPDIYGT